MPPEEGPEDIASDSIDDDSSGLGATSLEYTSNPKGIFGAQNIGWVGSIALMVNNVISPGMVTLPLIYQQSGWLIPTLSLLFAFVCSSFACIMVAEAMQLAPGNRRFVHRLEYCDVLVQYFGHRGYGSAAAWHLASLFFYNACLTCLNMGSIIIMAQTADQILLFIFRVSYALEVYPNVGFIKETAVLLSNSTALPFATDDQGAVNPVVLTLGYVISSLTFIPMGFMTLEENVYYQLVAFVMFISLTLFFTGLFATDLSFDRLPMVGTELGQSFSVAMFCFSYAITIPSWVNEKRPDVGVASTIWYSALPSTVIQIAFGVLGAMAFDGLSDNVMLDLVAHQSNGTWGSTVQILVFFFTLLVMGLGIPLFHIYVRYNLANGGVCSIAASNFWGVFFPWLVSWALYGGDLYQQFLNYSSLLFTTLTCYLLPIVMYIIALNETGKSPPVSPLIGLADPEADMGTEDHNSTSGECSVLAVSSVPTWLGDAKIFAWGLLVVTTAALMVAVILQFIPTM